MAASDAGKALGRRIRGLRHERGLTLHELGQSLGVRGSAVQNLESRGVETISTLEAVAEALRVDLVVELRERVA